MKKPKKQKASTMHFWRAASILLSYRKQIIMAVGAMLVSSICFAGGLTTIPVTFKLVLEDKKTLPDIIDERATSVPDWIPFVNDLLTPERLATFKSVLPQTAYGGITTILVASIVMLTIGVIASFLHQYMVVTIAYRSAMSWRKKLVDKLVGSPYETLISRSGSEDASRILNDSTVMASGFERVMGRELGEIARGIACLIAALIADWQLSMIAVGVGLIAGLFLAYVGKVIRKASKGALQFNAKMLSYLNAWVHAPFVVKVHAAEGVERRRFARVNRGLYREQLRMRLVKAISSPMTRLLSFIAVAIAGQWAAYLILEEGYSFEELFRVLILLVTGGASLKPIEKINSAIQHASAAAERVMEIVDLDEEKDDEHTQHQLQRHGSNIRFQNITYYYPAKTSIETPENTQLKTNLDAQDESNADRQAALENVSLEVNFGQTVAIVGGNGSGKTTLLSMLPKLLIPTEGKVFIDDTDISMVRLRSLRKQMSVVSQNSVLFEGSVAENISYGQLATSHEDIVKSAKAAHAHEFIEALPQGYQTQLGEGGSGLSGGQRQRLCIARAVLRDPAILILDEATSQIDSKSESEINAAIQELSRNRTTFIIAHRLSTVVDADLIVVMKDSRIVAQGKHEDLLRESQEYQRLTQTQLVKGSAVNN